MKSPLLYQLKCCFGPFGCSCLCIRRMRESSTTAVMYSILLVLGSIVLILSHDNRLIHWAAIKFNSNFNKTCISIGAELNCERLKGYVAVYRIAYAFTCFHLIMAIFCLCVGSSQEWRARVHNGFWFFKCLAITLIWTTFYLLPVFENILFIATMVGVIAAVFFIIIQQVSVIDCTYEFNNYLCDKGSTNCCFNFLLYVITGFLYFCAIFGYVFLFFKFAIPHRCVRNRVIIIVNASASSFIVLFSFFINKHNQYKLYIPGAFTCVLVCYLTLMAFSSAPNEILKDGEHVPEADIRRIVQFNNQTLFICSSFKGIYVAHIESEIKTYIGIIFMLCTAVYYSIGATLEYKRYGIKPARSKMQMLSSLTDKTNEESEMQNLQKSSKKRISGSFLESNIPNITDTNKRYISMPNLRVSNEAIGLNMSGKYLSQKKKFNKTKNEKPNLNVVSKKLKKQRVILRTNSALPSGKLSSKKRKVVSAIDESYSRDNVSEHTYVSENTNYPVDDYVIHDEYNGVRYSYSWLHFSFALAYLFVMAQLTNWYSPEGAHLSQLNTSMESMWIKIVTCWTALGLYTWSLFFPAFCIGRKLYEFPLTSLRRYHKQTDNLC